MGIKNKENKEKIGKNNKKRVTKQKKLQEKSSG